MNVYLDPDDLVYQAEAQAEADCCGDGKVAPDDLVGFCQRALRAAGWSVDQLPEFALDVPDDAEWSGHAGSSNVIHLHPRLLDHWTVLHELSHWADNRGGHGPIFRANLVSLHYGIDPDAGNALRWCYVEFGLELDPWRLPEGLR